jgi:hypothetical protein
MRNGMKYHVLVRRSWYRWRMVVVTNKAMKMVAAAREGSYRYASKLLSLLLAIVIVVLGTLR